MNLSEITPLLITYNEMDNLPRTFAGLDWARQIVVMDSFSNDGTVEFVRSDSRVILLQRKFDRFARQCQAGLDGVSTPWVLSLDADYCVTPELLEEIKALDPGTRTAFQTSFLFSMHGKILRASLYPPRFVLFKKGFAQYEDDGHGHRIVPCGETGSLTSPMIHDDRKSFARWWSAQKKYARQEAEKLRHARWAELPLQDRLRLFILPAPLAMALYTLLGKQLLLDGPPGWFYCFQRTLAEVLLSVTLLRTFFTLRGFSICVLTIVGRDCIPPVY